MKSNVISNILLFLGCCLVGFSAWSYLNGAGHFDVNNCGLTVKPAQSGSVELPTFSANASIPLKLVNTTGKKARVLGNNACCGFAFDFGSRQIPFEIEVDETLDFNLNVHTLAAGEADTDFVIYMGVDGWPLIELPVKFKIHVVESETEKTNGETQDVAEEESP